MIKKCLAIALCAGLALGGTVKADVIAWWNFEQGADGEPLPTSVRATTFTHGMLDVSGNGNQLVQFWDPEANAFEAGTSTYFDHTNLPPVPGPNSSVARNPLTSASAFPAMFTWSAQSNPSGVDIESVVLSTWSIELFFNPTDFTGFANALVGRDGGDIPGPIIDEVAPLYFQLRDFSGDKRLFCEYFDQGTTPTAHSVSGNTVLTTDTWYYVAAVNDGTSLTLWLANLTDGDTAPSLDGYGNINQSSTDTSFGPWPDFNPPEDPNPRASWTVGRGYFNSGDGDRFFGYLDEVKIHDVALDVLTEGMLALGSVPVELGSFKLE